ncbi:hypothetical protein J6590_056814 [Homalodisca vitripennis]|nr:hypothetical protein J6590_056814 [Homalodisca vitripennis]
METTTQPISPQYSTRYATYGTGTYGSSPGHSHTAVRFTKSLEYKSHISTIHRFTLINEIPVH